MSGRTQLWGPTGPLGPPSQEGDDKARPVIGRIMPLMREARGHLVTCDPGSGILIYGSAVAAALCSA